MKNTIETMLKRPVATAGLIGFVTYCAIRVIDAVKSDSKETSEPEVKE